ncbi:MAG TPA: LLM class flavin-dependent oxidoreductase [Candidatus Dormibacteraeota bacterium]|nr:LLM class flavin-dependent oxidoreductase [Candidatus Dormibacteraeota bacterium]
MDRRWTGRNLGFTCHTADLSWDELIPWVQEAERLGYSAFCTTEESGKDAFAVLAVLARETKTISLGTAIVNFYSRTPTLLAMSARSIHDLSGGRFGPFGLGAGGIGFMQRGHGIVIEKPLARAKETVAIVRGLLTQKKFSYDGQWFKPHDFHLREGPIGEGAPPIWLAGLGPKMVGTAAAVADGVIANWLTEESLAEYRGLIKEGAKSAGRDPSSVQIATLLMTCVDPGDEAAIFAARRGIGFYCASEHYLHIADICGLGDDARKVKVAWEERDFDRATNLVSDRLLEKFSLAGSARENAQRIQWLFDNSVYPIVYPLPRHARMVEDHHTTLRLAAEWARSFPGVAPEPVR